ncbi:MAG: transglycosylase SLT domain-containing protein [Thiobacillaceae bacterium]
MFKLPTLVAIALGLCSSTALAITAAPAPELKISYSLNGTPLVQDGDARPQDLWERIRSGFRLAEVNPELTRRHERWFLERAQHLTKAIERSRPYLYHIVEEVERRGMPMEVALLPLIESAFNPMAESPKKAAGIWQFIPATGRVFGLKQNPWYDGRRDVLAATRAALDYLQTLHRQFGSWELALAAYNCGEGCLARAIARNRARGLSTAYAALPLPTETRHYVPKLLAVRNLVQDPENSGLALQAIDNEPYFVQVKLTQPMPVRQVARLADISLEEFLALNPAFQRRIIHTDTRGILLLPADKVETFQQNLQRKGTERPTLQLYQARKGERLQSIADQFGVTLEWLKEHNPIKASRGRLTAAQSLYVPMPSKPGNSQLVQNEPIQTQDTGVRRRDI